METIDQTFDKIDYTLEPLKKGEYEKCEFSQCNFTNGDISHIQFSECEFVGCNISMTQVLETSFRDVVFRNCKLMGITFGNCSNFLFSVDFEKCVLNLSSFHRLKMRKTKMSECSLQETSFAETDLGESVFDRCDFSQTLFHNTILEKVDFRTSYNYVIDPEVNKIKKAQFSHEGIHGLLLGYDINIS